MASGSKTFLGTGWTFPVQEAATREVALVSLEEDVRQAVLIILGTSPGERVMRPDFGAGLRAFVFEPMNTATLALVRRRVEQSLLTWEPRIDNITVQVTTDAPSGRLLIELRYRVRATNTFYNLVYPFYLMEGETQ